MWRRSEVRPAYVRTESSNQLTRSNEAHGLNEHEARQEYGQSRWSSNQPD